MTINCKAAKNVIRQIYKKKEKTKQDMNLLRRISEAAQKTPGCDLSDLKGGRKRRRTKRRKKTKKRTKRRKGRKTRRKGKKSRKRRRR
tara:strand:+ start:2353 stop:2616 length:264 start_codon:yes stop_codon:yes gene_type:complete